MSKPAATWDQMDVQDVDKPDDGAAAAASTLEDEGSGKYTTRMVSMVFSLIFLFWYASLLLSKPQIDLFPIQVHLLMRG